MSTESATFRGSRSALLERLHSLAHALATGEAGGARALVDECLRAAGMEALAIVREAFETKSEGGTDEAGISWTPIAAQTVARKDGKVRTPETQKEKLNRWTAAYNNALRAGRKPDDAAAVAWVVVKTGTRARRRGKVVASVLPSSQRSGVGVASGRLLASLTPGHPDCLLEISAGKATIGTRVPYASDFGAKRPLWPEGEWPVAWQDRIAEAMTDGIASLAAALARGGAQ